MPRDAPVQEIQALVGKVSQELEAPGAIPRLSKRSMRPVSEYELRDCLSKMFGGNGLWVGAYSDLKNELEKTGDLRRWLSKQPRKAAIVLHRWRPDYGHWTCMFMQPGGKLQLFDSTAAEPDSLRDKQSAEDARALGQDRASIVRALRGEPARYNDYPLQSSETQTCGRWCMLRLAMRKLSEDEFADTIYALAEHYGVPPDLVATAATS